MEKNSVLKLEKVIQLPPPTLTCGISSPLLRRFLHRDLSPLLIVILLCLSPLTFSNENTPNFQPDCAASFSLAEKTRSAVVNTRAVTPFLMDSSAAGVVLAQVHYLLTHSTPLHSVKTSRAPPLIFRHLRL
jgi:hypothetical protein